MIFKQEIQMKSKRFFAAIFCLALVISLATVVFATPSTLLLEDFYGGYECYGYGSFTSTEAKATFQTYTDNPSHVPESECSCFVGVTGYRDDYLFVAYNDIYKDTYGISAAVTAEIDGTSQLRRIEFVVCEYDFLGYDFGDFELR